MTSSARGALVIAGLLWAGAPVRADGRVVVVTCPDAVTAHLRVAPAPAAGPLARSLDLGDVPGDLRVRLIALAGQPLQAHQGRGRAHDPVDPEVFGQVDLHAIRQFRDLS